MGMLVPHSCFRLECPFAARLLSWYSFTRFMVNNDVDASRVVFLAIQAGEIDCRWAAARPKQCLLWSFASATRAQLSHSTLYLFVVCLFCILPTALAVPVPLH